MTSLRLLSILSTALALAACGSGDDSPRTATPTATAVATASSSVTPSVSDTPQPTATRTAPSTPTSTATPDNRLGSLASAAGVFVGAAFVEGSEEAQFRSMLVSEFNSTTAPLYWSSTQPQPGTFDFTAADAALAVAEPAGLRVRGHPLVWGRLALPDYVQQMTDPDQLRALMSEHIQKVVGRYRGHIAQYDVVNEPITFSGQPGPTGQGLEDYVFLRLLGPGYVREALDLAHGADPDARLFINEFFVERPGPKQDYFFQLVQGLVADGAPLHGVGFQGHITPPFGSDYLPTRAELAAAIQRFAALGLAVEISELDVTLRDPAAELEAQGRIYGDIFAGCFMTPGCQGITTWGMSDRATWIRNFFFVEGAPLLYDIDFQPKPAYFAAQNVLREIAGR